jgi:hypothetical protein
MKTKEVMLSENASVIAFIKSQQKIVSDADKSRREAKQAGHGGCFRINGKIVH